MNITIKLIIQLAGLTKIFLIFFTTYIFSRFELQRRKYVVWKNNPGSGFSTPNSVNRKSYLIQDDPHTSIDDIPLLPINKQKKRSRRRKDRFHKAANIIRKHIQIKKAKPKFHSLPTSPYLTRRLSLDSIPGSIPKVKEVNLQDLKRQ